MLLLPLRRFAIGLRLGGDMANWVIGYFGTGKPWVSIPQPGAQSSFDQSMTSDKVTLHLASGFESHQAAVNVLSKALDYRYYIARLEDDLRVSSAGIVNRLEVDESGWSISGEGFESYLSRRVIIDPRDWAAEALERQPVYNYSGTWRQIVWQAVVDIISRTSNRIKPPVRLLGSLTEGRERKTETVEAIDLVSMGEFIDKIRGKEDGVEIRLGAQWHGSLQTGNLEWTISVGTEQRPFLIPTYRFDGQPRVWPINPLRKLGVKVLVVQADDHPRDKQGSNHAHVQRLDAAYRRQTRGVSDLGGEVDAQGRTPSS